MANKLIKRRYNNLLTARNNYFGNGGDAGNANNTSSGTSGPLLDILRKVPNLEAFLPDTQNLKNNIKLSTPTFTPIKDPKAEQKGALINAAGAAVGQIGGGLIGGGLQSGAGSVFQGLSSVAAAIPGPWGAVASAGLGVLGGLTNRMFGSKMNTENIAKVEANINNLKNFQSDASDFDTLSQTWGNTAMGTNFANSYIGKDGWFSSKAKNKAKALRTQMEQANAWAQSTLENNANNIGLQQADMLEQNYAAFGGPLFAEGGRIHIKPENRGKFTETKRRTGKTTEELTHSKNPVTRKRAIFALNSRQWNKHSNGGYLEGKEYDLDELEIKRLIDAGYEIEYL